MDLILCGICMLSLGHTLDPRSKDGVCFSSARWRQTAFCFSFFRLCARQKAQMSDAENSDQDKNRTHRIKPYIKYYLVSIEIANVCVAEKKKLENTSSCNARGVEKK